MPEVKTPEYYYPPSKITFKIQEIVWVIREAWEVWPPQDVSYFDARLDVDAGGYKTTPCQAAQEVINEIKARLTSCGKAGLRMIEEVQSEAFMGVDLWSFKGFKEHLTYDSRLVLIYLAGYRLKGQNWRHLTPFRVWKCRNR
jgi:hypothetical protein